MVAKLPVYKIKHQLNGWKRVRMTAVLRGGQRTITSFLSAAPPPCNVVVTRTAATAPLTSDANRRTQTTIPFARAQPAATRLSPAVTDRHADQSHSNRNNQREPPGEAGPGLARDGVFAAFAVGGPIFCQRSMT